ncbi:MAG: discoidin domain-containing protein, partial [Bacteroidaceae bacterium]|nr:discoidin domain-containing protein [Bacteroidaceae bacterium]
MRKFTFILSLLVAFVATAMAQVEVGKVYTMTLKNNATSAVTESSEYLSVSTLAEGEKSQQWLIEAGENGVMVRNMSTGRYMNPMGTSNQWTTVQYDPIALYAVAVGDYFTLNTADNTDGYQAMHMAGHGAIVGWETAADNTQWNFTEVAVDAAELETLVAEWNALIEKAKAADALSALIEQISSSIGKIALTTSMISTNSTGYGDGTFADMLDGNLDTHYGTSWWGTIGANHYVQIDLGEQPADITEFTYTWVNRKSGNNTPYAGYISASTDNDTFDTLVSFDKDA